jgi:glycosyltransferase involved in cell wall biosynthesis
VADDLRRALGLKSAHVVRIYNGYDVDAIRDAAREPSPTCRPDRSCCTSAASCRRSATTCCSDAFKQAGLAHKLVLLTEPTALLTSLINESGLEKQVSLRAFAAIRIRGCAPRSAGAFLRSRRHANVLVEALICGTRVVSTDCPSGPREILKGELARGLVPTGDAAALAAAMRTMLAAPRADASAVTAEFTQERMVSAYEALAGAT